MNPKTPHRPNSARLKRKLLRLLRGLEKMFGVPRRRRGVLLLDSLIRTILSQSTTDHNRDLAYARFRERFPRWEDVLKTREEDLAEAIRPGGLANQKAGRIRAFLRWLKETRGEFSLEFLREAEPGEALKLLTPHKGIGVKTVFVMLMAAAGKDVFPVDTHIHRIARRLGLIGPKTTPEKAHFELAPLVPKGKAYFLHMNLLAFGRTICTARNPRCGDCPFRSMCLYYRELKASAGPGTIRRRDSGSRASR